MRLKDDDGNWVTHGDEVNFSYGIPPISVTGKVVEKNAALIVLTPGHDPPEGKLRSLRYYVGGWWLTPTPRV